MQFKIPVDVQVEDKIVGPLTLRQLIIVGAGGGVAYALYIILSRTYFWEVYLFPVGLITIITLLVAFARINDMTFTKYLLHTIEFNLKPRKRVWKKGSAETYKSVLQVTKVTPQKQKKKDKNPEEELSQEQKIDKLMEVINSNKKPH